MRTTPQVRFSRARRRMSSITSSGSGGRPGGLGSRHFAATSRRCQVRSIPGVTSRLLRSPFGSTRASAASAARSDQDSFGFGLARRSTATSWRSASISASLEAEDRASNESQDTTVTSSRYTSGTSTSADHADREGAGRPMARFRPAQLPDPCRGSSSATAARPKWPLFSHDYAAIDKGSSSTHSWAASVAPMSVDSPPSWP